MNPMINGVTMTNQTRRSAPAALLGDSPAMKEVFRLVERVSPTDASVLITGESGSGKEVVAKFIHDRSPRADEPFIVLNCGAVPAELIEAELFGQERGRSDGAARPSAGAFERAEGGTLFLDEIAELSPEIQTRLLRVLEMHSFYRVGGTAELPSDVRVIAAVNGDPLAAVQRGRLREDLLYRLAVFPVSVPPLRNRGEDVVQLADRFLADLNQRDRSTKRFAAGTTATLKGHSWPGNVRELKNCVERAFIMGDTDVIELAPLIAKSASAGEAGFANAEKLEIRVGSRIDEVERSLIEATLQHFRGNKRRAADTLGCSLKTLYNKLNAYSQAQQSMAGT